ncbi:hypothetical protein FQN57_000231 [Myotisia sp. PD_48]|nr:hypothetical protein FQN57_000231 [Myotisia sp. PD_48]
MSSGNNNRNSGHQSKWSSSTASRYTDPSINDIIDHYLDEEVYRNEGTTVFRNERTPTTTAAHGGGYYAPPTTAAAFGSASYTPTTTAAYQGGYYTPTTTAGFLTGSSATAGYQSSDPPFPPSCPDFGSHTSPFAPTSYGTANHEETLNLLTDPQRANQLGKFRPKSKKPPQGGKYGLSQFKADKFYEDPELEEVLDVKGRDAQAKRRTQYQR